jgi:DNA polymerase I
MPTKARLFLVDGHALAYRTYFALTGVGGGERWITKSGEPTAGTYGFAAVLLKLLEDERPEYLAVSFDTGKTFRDELYPEYKATREKMPDDLRLQIERIRELVTAFGIPVLEAEGFEADDVLGTVARLASEQGVKVVILTGDRDLLQLASDSVVIRLAGQKLSEAADFGPSEVAAKLGVAPDQVVDYKALVGDTSDNIPGVRGVGEKTAVSLIEQYGSLDNIYAHLEEIQTRFRTKLESGREQAYLSQKLAAISTQVPIKFELEACRAQAYNRDQVVELFRELEFRSLLDRIPSGAESGSRKQLDLFVSEAPPPASPLEKVIVVDEPGGLDSLVRVLSQADQISFDVETTSTDSMQAELVGISLSVDPDTGYYIPVGHTAAAAPGHQLPLDRVLSALSAPLTDPKIGKLGHNVKYDAVMLTRAGLRPQPLTFDTMLAEWLCDPGSRNLGLKSLAWVRLGIEMTEISALIGTGRSQRTMAEVPVAEAAPYAAADAAVTLRLVPQLRQELEDKQQTGLMETLEMPLVPVLAEMEMAGIALDEGFLGQLSKELAARLVTIEDEIFQHVGRPFNLNSPQQLSEVLFGDLKIDPPDRTRKTSSGFYSTAASVLEELRQAHPVVELILEAREVAKLKSTYADALRTQVNPQTGRVHTSYSQTGSVTGRLASSEPNLQNIPIRTELGRQIRRAFVADAGQVLVAVDYSQIELRIVAHMADDQAMIGAFKQDQDIHATTAAAVFSVKPNEVTSDMRRRAKAVNFGLIYGMSAYGLSRSTDLTLSEAEDFVKAYFERFPGVKRYLDQTREAAVKNGYVETLLGRRRYFPQLGKGGPAVSEVARARAMREAVNAPIQGTAADIIELAMIRMPKAFDEAGLLARMLLQVHDELVFEAPETELPRTVEVVKQIMGEAYELNVPLKTDATAGRNWYDMQPVE